MQARTAILGAIMALSTTGPLWCDSDYPYRPVPFHRVKITDDFWGKRIKTNRDVTVWYDFKKCEETDRIANFARAGGLEPGTFVGIAYNDSDVYKVIEGAAYLLAQERDPRLEAYVDDVIRKIAAAQEDDGYLYTARTIGHTDDRTGPTRWSHLAHSHELYNVGHLYEAAVAYHQATGKKNLLDVALKNADFLCNVFGPNEGQIIAVPGHEEIEMGLVKLYRLTGRQKYLDLAKFFIDMRGRSDLRKVYGDYCQDHQPLLEQREAVGHAVRAFYFYAGVADVAAITGNAPYIEVLNRIWDDVVGTKMYLIGNVGDHRRSEGFAEPYHLDNLQAYNETCSAIALALWNHRMFLLHGDAKYIDVLERAVYNGFLSGVSMSGDRFFYPNPLTCDMQFKFNHGSLERSPWFDCSCCPVNVVRFIPSIAGAIYAHNDQNIYVNLYIASEAQVELKQGPVTIRQQSSYPWDGTITLHVDLDRPMPMGLRLRIPGWSQGQPTPAELYRYVGPIENDQERPILAVNGDSVPVKLERGYAVIDREWHTGDEVVLKLPMPVRRVQAREEVEADRGRIAIERGPLVYCLEGADHDGSVLNLRLARDTGLTATHRPELLGGVTTLAGQGQRHVGDQAVAASLTFIPYYAWCHRGANEMAVWIPVD